MILLAIVIDKLYNEITLNQIFDVFRVLTIANRNSNLKSRFITKINTFNIYLNQDIIF